MKKFALLCTLLAAGCAPAASDSAPNPATGNDAPIPYVTGSNYDCTPSGFTLTQTQVLDTGGQYRLDGTLQMPTPGYSYEFVPQPSLTVDHHVYNLNLTAPSGMSAQVITPMEISYEFSAVPYLQDVRVMVNGGGQQPETITCRINSAE